VVGSGPRPQKRSVWDYVEEQGKDELDRKKEEVKAFTEDRHKFYHDELQWRNPEALQAESENMANFENARLVSKLEPGASSIHKDEQPVVVPKKKSVFDYVEDKSKEEEEAIRLKMDAQKKEQAEFYRHETHWRSPDSIQEEHARMDVFETKPIVSKLEKGSS